MKGSHLFRSLVFAGASFLAAVVPVAAQTAGTGAIAGVVRDPSGALVPSAAITVTNTGTGLVRRISTNAHGEFEAQILEPGSYKIEITKPGFSAAQLADVVVNVTQVTSANVKLVVGTPDQTVEVEATGGALQTESSALGSVVTGETVRELPLATRNYTQIITLSPGVSSDVTNVAAFGRGSFQVVAAGTASSENNFQMDGVEINDLQGSGSFSGNIAIPNPDTIQEFKVQTSQYDAAYGRNAGANVNVVTRTGTNQFHGSVWEFFRNDDLNANDSFLKGARQPRPAQKQNQPGFTLGGPIKRDEIFGFISYQSTRQVNGEDPQCSTTLHTPPLTNDRSAAALGALFSNQPTFWQALGLSKATGLPGATVAANGSNIAPQALALLNLKLPNGQYVIPTPQSINPALGFANEGVSVISLACHFNEDQFVINGDYDQSTKSQWQARFFFANSQQAYTLPNYKLSAPTAPGFPQDTPNHYRNVSLLNNYVFSPHLLNQAEFGFHRTWVDTAQQEPFQYSTIGASVPAYNVLPAISVLGSIGLGGNGQTVTIDQDTWVYQDTVSWTRGPHALRFGGGVTQVHNNIDNFTFLGGVLFGTFPDLLLGQSAAQNGTLFSNMYLTVDLPSQLQRKFTTLDYNAYAQDDWKITPNLTLNLGFRFDRLGDITDRLGRNSNFDITRANPTPPASGSLQGFVVEKNFPGTVPAGVIQNSGKLVIAGNGQNTLNPRVGFAYQLPGTESRVVLRGGYGLFHETPTGQPFLQLLTNPPFSQLRQLSGVQNGASNWAQPFAPFTATFPIFSPYTPTSALSLTAFANSFRPAVVQHYSLNTQTALTKDTVLEVGYLGTRGQHLPIQILPDQALLATPGAPVRGQTTNTLANLSQRLPVQGFSVPGFGEIQSEGNSWYNAMLVNFTQQFKGGNQIQVAYTWSRALSDSAAQSTGANGGTRIGDQTNSRGDYGPDLYARPHRFVANFVYEIPTPFRKTSLLGETLGSWAASGVITVQAGHFLYFTNTNAGNAFGINSTDQDFAQVSPSCTNSQLANTGSVTAKQSNFFNRSCFFQTAAPTRPLAYPTVTTDGGTGFGNSRVGVVRGPAQNDVDLAARKGFTFRALETPVQGEFRAEFFNAFNAVNFRDPSTAVDQSFGIISGPEAVAPRTIQFAVKLSF